MACADTHPIERLNPEKIELVTATPSFVSPQPGDVTCAHRVAHHPFPSTLLDEDALKVVRRLTRFGHETYLVGGCVRDLLLGKVPKDFDVATSAQPGQVKKLFRNCRLIGRRFRLAHMLFRDGKVIEVATFRRSATNEDDISERHAAENLFGGPADDAVRRDFTINALFYDVDRREIHDFVGGLDDVAQRRMRTIGDPVRRFQEDPVRVIRAVKFAVMHDLHMDDETVAAARDLAHLLKSCPTARLVEELFKILRTGHAAACLRRLHEMGVLPLLMPHVRWSMSGDEESGPMRSHKRLLEALDAHVAGGNMPSEPLMIACVCLPTVEPLLNDQGDVSSHLDEALRDCLAPMCFTRRHVAGARMLLLAQRRLAKGHGSRRARRMLDRDYALDAAQLMGFGALTEEERGQADEWTAAALRRRSTKRAPAKRGAPRPRRPRP